jgi:hypothetical protein
MSILSELTGIIASVYPVETGVFSEETPDEYSVLTPMSDMLDLYADNFPSLEINSVRISIFSKNNYIAKVRKIKKDLLAADFTITDSQLIGREDDTGYYHYNIDVQKYYDFI